MQQYGPSRHREQTGLPSLLLVLPVHTLGSRAAVEFSGSPGREARFAGSSWEERAPEKSPARAAAPPIANLPEDEGGRKPGKSLRGDFIERHDHRSRKNRVVRWAREPSRTIRAIRPVLAARRLAGLRLRTTRGP